MAQPITPIVVDETLGELEAYGQWQEAQRAERLTASSTPHKIDVGNREHLLAQTALLDASTEEATARILLMVELAEQDDNFLPLVHRLGLLAAFDNPMTGNDFSLRNLSLSHFRKEDQIRPSANFIGRSLQIADELTAVIAELESDKPVTVAMVENEYCMSCRRDYDLVAEGSISDPEAAVVIEEPTVTLSDSKGPVTYHVPTALKGVGQLHGFAGHIAVTPYRAEPLRYSTEPVVDGEITPPLPRLVRLVRGANRGYVPIDALYLGDRATKRIARAKMVSDGLGRPRFRGGSRRARRKPRY